MRNNLYPVVVASSGKSPWWQFLLQVLSALVAALSAHTMLFFASIIGV